MSRLVGISPFLLYNTRESPLYRNAMFDALLLLESGFRKYVFIGLSAYGSSSGRAPAAARASSLQVAASSKHLGSQPADFARSAIQSGAFGRKKPNMPLIAWVGFKGICLIFFENRSHSSESSVQRSAKCWQVSRNLIQERLCDNTQQILPRGVLWSNWL